MPTFEKNHKKNTFLQFHEGIFRCAITEKFRCCLTWQRGSHDQLATNQMVPYEAILITSAHLQATFRRNIAFISYKYVMKMQLLSSVCIILFPGFLAAKASSAQIRRQHVLVGEKQENPRFKV